MQLQIGPSMFINSHAHFTIIKEMHATKRFAICFQ